MVVDKDALHEDVRQTFIREPDGAAAVRARRIVREQAVVGRQSVGCAAVRRRRATEDAVRGKTLANARERNNAAVAVFTRIAALERDMLKLRAAPAAIAIDEPRGCTTLDDEFMLWIACAPVFIRVPTVAESAIRRRNDEVSLGSVRRRHRLLAAKIVGSGPNVYPTLSFLNGLNKLLDRVNYRLRTQRQARAEDEHSDLAVLHDFCLSW